MLGSGSILETDSRRDSRKRRRLSERRRVFSRIGANGDSTPRSMSMTSSTGQDTRRRPSSTLLAGRSGSSLFKSDNNRTLDLEDHSFLGTSRSESPILGGDQSKISMKIQFHITVAPENEPLILDTSHYVPLNDSNVASPTTAPTPNQPESNRKRSTDSLSIADQIHERLNRQSTSSTRRRQQLLAMHNQSALDNNSNNNNGDRLQQGRIALCAGLREEPSSGMHSEDNITFRASLNDSLPLVGGAPAGREPGARSSTITGGMQDEATLRFLARHQLRPSGSLNLSGSPGTPSASATNLRRSEREQIYFKRDGQRFGHEFTLKLAVDKNYRCLLKVRPLIPLQAISIQGHHVAFVDCSTNPGANLSLSAPASSVSLSNSWQSINGNKRSNLTFVNYRNTNHHNTSKNHHSSTTNNSHSNGHHHHHNHNHRLNHAQTTAFGADRRMSSALNSPDTGEQHQTSPLSSALSRQLQQQLLKQQQHTQMMRHFAASHCSPSGSHLGGQLIYMFDWSAGRFEVNKNKARTQVQTVLKFKNGQILSLPLQVKFYQPESKQHLNWGSQLHFIDYDCNINNMGQINVDRIQYY